MSAILKRSLSAVSVPSPRLRTLLSAENERLCLGLLWLAISLYILLFLRLIFRLQDHYTIMGYDIGIFDQAAWLISHGKEPFITVRGLPLLADHFSAILYLLAPLYWLWPSPKMLMLVQTVALSLGALPIYALARTRIKSSAVALILAATYLFYPAMQWTNAFEFHPETLATPLLLAAFWFLTQKRWLLYFSCLLLATLTKEVVGLSVIALGIYVFFTKETYGSRRIGGFTAGLGLIMSLVGVETVRYFNHGAPSPFFALYGQYGHTPGQIALNLLGHPVQTAEALTSPLNRRYLFLLFYPLLFLIILAPEILLLTLPALLANMLSSRFVMHTIEHQYTTLITPFVFIAAVIGFARGQRGGSRLTSALILTYIVLTALSGVLLGPQRAWSGAVTPGLTARQAQDTDTLLAAIPPDASVCAQAVFLPHLGHRPQVYTFPNPFHAVTWGYGAAPLKQMEQLEFTTWPHSKRSVEISQTAPKVDYIVLSPHTTIWPLVPAIYSDYFISLLASHSYGIVGMTPTTMLLRRGADYRRGLHLFEKYSGMPIRHPRDLHRAFRRWIRGVNLKI